MSYTFHQEHQKWQESQGAGDGDAVSAEQDADAAVDPTGMTGTLDTSGTTGTTETAQDVSAIFDVADEEAAKHPAPEGTPFAPEVDPAAEGEDALEPDYSQVATDEDGNYKPNPDEETLVNTQTTDTTDTAGTDGSAKAHEGSEKVGAEAAQDAKEEQEGDEESFDATKDPGEYKAAEVVAFLKGASAADKKKVLKKEQSGDNRKTVVDAAQA